MTFMETGSIAETKPARSSGLIFGTKRRTGRLWGPLRLLDPVSVALGVPFLPSKTIWPRIYAYPVDQCYERRDIGIVRRRQDMIGRIIRHLVDTQLNARVSRISAPDNVAELEQPGIDNLQRAVAVARPHSAADNHDAIRPRLAVAAVFPSALHTTPVSGETADNNDRRLHSGRWGDPQGGTVILSTSTDRLLAGLGNDFSEQHCSRRCTQEQRQPWQNASLDRL